MSVHWAGPGLGVYFNHGESPCKFIKTDSIKGLFDQRESKSHSFPTSFFSPLLSHYLKLRLRWILGGHVGTLYGRQKKWVLKAARMAVLVPAIVAPILCCPYSLLCVFHRSLYNNKFELESWRCKV